MEMNYDGQEPDQRDASYGTGSEAGKYVQPDAKPATEKARAPKRTRLEEEALELKALNGE